MSDVLLVEDDLRLANALRRGLASAGMAVDVQPRGAEALRRAETTRYSAVILDLSLPDVSGYQVIQELRCRGNWVPIIVLTGHSAAAQIAAALDQGADDYLTKPFSFVVLLSRLQALTRRALPPRPTLLSVDDLVLDPAKHTVVRGDTPINLTRREFSLLEFLMRRQHDAVSKSTLLNHVWNLEPGADPNVVEVYIGYLRRKIDAPFGTTTLRTVRGAGYRLTETHAQDSRVPAPV